MGANARLDDLAPLPRSLCGRGLRCFFRVTEAARTLSRRQGSIVKFQWV